MNVTRSILLLLALAACGDDAAPYPTEVRRVPAADGRVVEVVGAPMGDVCIAIADAACDGDRCRLEFYARCNPAGRGGLIEATSVELWDKLWADCLSSAVQMGASWPGKNLPGGCERLTPLWSE